MQMFLWSASSGGVQNILTVNSPIVISGTYGGAEATFGPGLPTTPLTGDVVLVDDGSGAPTEGCNALVNGAQISGNIAIVDRGNCPFVDKVQNAQDAGAIAVIVVNNAGTAPFGMGGTSGTINIPSIMISQADGNAIKAQLGVGSAVNVTLLNTNPSFNRDGDFDNGIIAHEYGHGVSIRLTGGASTSGCLSNAEQMGEGWSDYFGLYLSLDTTVISRGIGTFAVDEPTNGGGIRPAQYSPDFNVNPFTYANTNAGVSQPHGIGFVWCSMLWDLTLELIDQYGFDEDFYYGTGGNNIALQLVMDGLKLQACNPGSL